MKNLIRIIGDQTQKQFYFATAGYLLLFSVAYYILYQQGVLSAYPNNSNLIKWDANWYESIRNKNYEFFWYMASNTAFFPLFSYGWKLLGLGNVGVSIFNLFLFLLSLNLLYRTFSISIYHLLIYISFPSILFFGVPMSEAFFFFFCTLFLIGLKKNNLILILTGLLLASLTRATAMFFVPCIIAMELSASGKLFDKFSIKNILLFSAVALVGLMIVVLIQYAYTGVWFAFAKQQIRFWKHPFDLPTFPLVSHGGENTIWLDGGAFILGFVCLIVSVFYFFRKVFRQKTEVFSVYKDKAFLYSLFYVSIITVYALFFNSKCMEAQTTIDSLSRYFFCTSFFFIVLSQLKNYIQLSLKNYFILLALFVLGFYLIGLNGDPLAFFSKEGSPLRMTYLLFGAMFIYFHLLCVSIFNMKFSVIATAIIVLSNVFLGVYCLNHFLEGVYVG